MPRTTHEQKRELRSRVLQALARACKRFDHADLEALLAHTDEIDDVLARITRYIARRELVGKEARYLYEPEPLKNQVRYLQRLFPELVKADLSIADKNPLPKGAEGWSAIPRWQRLSASYRIALMRAILQLRQHRGGRLHNRFARRGFSPANYERNEAALEMLKYVDREQKDQDILIIPCQLGRTYWGQAPSRAQRHFGNIEFGLGMFEVVCIMLTHTIFSSLEQRPWIIKCVGDQCCGLSPDDIQNDHTPFIELDRARVTLNAGHVLDEDSDGGVATGLNLPYKGMVLDIDPIPEPRW